MKKTLYLVRHAQAESSSGMLHDKPRTLTPQGMIDVARMGKKILDYIKNTQQIPPQLMVSSAAERTQMTAQVLAEQLGLAHTIMVDETLFEGSPRHYLATINTLPEAVQSVMLVGHNPHISYLAEYLTHEHIGDMPTASILVATFDNLAWANITARSGKKIFYEAPEKIAGFDF